VREQITAELMLPEALITRWTLRDGVFPAVPEKQYPLFTAQIAGALAIEVDEGRPTEPNGIVR